MSFFSACVSSFPDEANEEMDLDTITKIAIETCLGKDNVESASSEGFVCKD